MLSYFTNLQVGKKIGYGFAAIGLVLLVTVATTMWMTSKVNTIFTRVVDNRVPTASASLMMINGMNHEIASLRGWMLLGEDKFKAERERANVEEIEPSLKILQKFAVNFSDPANKERMKVIEAKLEEFRKYQKDIEDIAQTLDNLPASKILQEEMEPQATILLNNMTRIIDIEKALSATSQRKALLSMMADVRGTTARSVGYVRAYLITGDQKFKDMYDKMWAKNTRRFRDLTKNAGVLNAEQVPLFNEITKARAVFELLPPKLFEIRSGDEWNKANKWLGTKSAPTAFAIKEQLQAMINSMQGLLAADIEETKSLSATLSVLLWVLLLVGGLMCAGLGWFITRAIGQPVEQVTQVAQELAKGNLTQEPLVINSKDELGILGTTCNQLLDQLKNYITNTEEVLAGTRSELSKGFEGDFETSLTRILAQANERKEMAKQALDYETKMVAVSKAQAVIEFSMEGTVITANDNFLMTMGYGLAEIEGKHHRIFCHPDYVSSPEYTAFWAKLNRGESATGAFLRLGKEGREVWIQASYTPIMDNNGKPIKVVKFATDITESKKLELEAERNKERELAQATKLQEGVTKIAEIGTTLASASEELTATSQQMASGAEETSSQANVVSAAAEEVSKNVQSVATGAEEMSATIKEVAKNTTDAAKVASQAVSVAETTNTTVAKLGESSAEIGSIIKVITSIAEQTNLLALNATIEAARAGEAGKGFAVVANEVKELAKETTKATENIGRMIETIQTDTQGAVEAIAQISGIIKQVNDFQNTIASAVEEQSVTTNEMTRNVTEASKGSTEIAGNITSVATAAQSTTAGANDTQTAAKELAGLASKLQSVVATLTN